MADHLIDEVDLNLLAALQQDARAPIATLCRAAHVSRATAYSRMNRLRDDGVITGLTACVDPTRVGLPVSVVLLVSMGGDSWQPWSPTGEELAARPEVEFAAHVTGEFDVVLLARFQDNEHLRSFLENDLRCIAGVQRARTLLVLEETPKRSMLLPTQRPASQAPPAEAER